MMLARIRRFLPLHLAAVLGPWGTAWGALLLLLIVVCAWALTTARQDIEGRAAMVADDLLMLADDAVLADVSRYETRLATVIADARGAGGLAAPAVTDELKNTWATDPDVRSLVVQESGGTVATLYARPGAAPPAALVQALLARLSQHDHATGLDIIAVRRKHGPQEVAVIRPCTDAAACGKLTAVVAFLSLDWIKSVFSKLQVGAAGEAGLIDPRGDLLAGVSSGPQNQAAEQRVMHALSGLPRGHVVVWQDAMYKDGMARRLSVAWVGDLPLVVYVSLSTADLMRGWRLLGALLVVAMAIMLTGFVILTVQLLRQLGQKMEIERDLRSANDQLVCLARTDGLTRLLNRRGFDEALEREWERCCLLERPISLLMIDVDFFKLYNDRYGHQAGDEVLRAIAGCLEACIRRAHDIAARYGGEELAVILPETRYREARVIAERIRASVEALGIPHAPGLALMTVSIGIGHIETAPSGPVEAMLAAADAALYQSKTSGRNRVSAASAEARDGTTVG
ncbi:GGDEF domain-containing protein [Acidisoma sp. C75]